MEIELTVMNESDFTIKDSVDRATGVSQKRGTFRALVMNPMNLLDIGITDSDIHAGVKENLLKKAGQPQKVFVDYKDQSFADENGKHVSIKRLVFIGFPNQPMK